MRTKRRIQEAMKPMYLSRLSECPKVNLFFSERMRLSDDWGGKSWMPLQTAEAG
jgi:hypothetical protein